MSLNVVGLEFPYVNCKFEAGFLLEWMTMGVLNGFAIFSYVIGGLMCLKYSNFYQKTTEE
ncbi:MULTISPECIES: hypothetical protein [Pseudoalteromonas]|uniref:hypothetical protein n=1 Tax=Pseudoalteromonas TaxID=53246 RepID=UPI0015818A26|nr:MULTISPECIES: hypothetical protein [Pseudoalteromonas]MDI4652540.1 hypothetical protein [Pseudoalteromonas shioyasakiensis]NUJ38752.1 hypothetical protein [Pseudoalteromonas sp. 0303]